MKFFLQFKQHIAMQSQKLIFIPLSLLIFYTINTSADIRENLPQILQTSSSTLNESDAGKARITPDVNIEKYPDRINSYSPEDQVTIGDMHGNTLKFIYFLIREGVLELDANPKTAKTLFESIKDIYNQIIITNASLVKFENILGNAKINSDAPKIRLIGDELGDRGKNDLLTLLVIEKLHKSRIPFEIILSNHSLGFLKVYEEYMLNDFKGTFEPGLFPFFSLEGLILSIDLNSHLKKRVLELIQNSYLPKLKIMSYSVDDKNHIVSLYSHAPVGFEGIEKLQAKYGITCSDIEVRPLLLIQCIDRINHAFKESFKESPRIFSSILTTDPGSDAVFYLVWNRLYDSLKQPVAFPSGTALRFVHGHDIREDKGPSHVVSLDNLLGKAPELNRGEYSIYVSTTEISIY